MRRLEGYPLPRAAAAVVAVSVACGVATAPILLFQFGSVPAYSVIANAMAAPVVAPLLGLGLARAALHPSSRTSRRCSDGSTAGSPRTSSSVRARSPRLPYAQLSTAPVLARRTCGLAAAIVVARRSRTLAVTVAAVVALVAIAWRGGARAGRTAAGRAARDVSRRRPRGRDAATGSAGRDARRPGAARGGRRGAAPPVRRPRAVAARAHASAAGSCRWRGRRPEQHPRPYRARPAAGVVCAGGARGDRWRRPRRAKFPSSPRDRGSGTRSGGCASACSGPTVQACRAKTRTSAHRLPRLVRRGRCTARRRRRVARTASAPPTAGRDSQGLPPRLGGCLATGAAGGDPARGWR